MRLLTDWTNKILASACMLFHLDCLRDPQDGWPSKEGDQDGRWRWEFAGTFSVEISQAKYFPKSQRLRGTHSLVHEVMHLSPKMDSSVKGNAADISRILEVCKDASIGLQVMQILSVFTPTLVFEFIWWCHIPGKCVDPKDYRTLVGVPLGVTANGHCLSSKQSSAWCSSCVGSKCRGEEIDIHS